MTLFSLPMLPQPVAQPAVQLSQGAQPAVQLTQRLPQPAVQLARRLPPPVAQPAVQLARRFAQPVAQVPQNSVRNVRIFSSTKWRTSRNVAFCTTISKIIEFEHRCRKFGIVQRNVNTCTYYFLISQ